MTKLTITQLGTPKTIQTKYGPKEKSFIKAQEHGNEFLSYWVSPMTREWKVGQVIEVVEVASREYNGKIYYDIILPKANGGNNTEVLSALSELNNRTLKMNILIEELVAHKRLQTGEDKPMVGNTGVEYPEMKEAPNFDPQDDGLDQLDESQIPF